MALKPSFTADPDSYQLMRERLGIGKVQVFRGHHNSLSVRLRGN